ncbi:hypothetical protein [Streptomyces naphthomycinicus]|uniref:hypothetical protein n=1 Tax=Streptomyces naphthomycinicus TaxID=2872625 RepID=UPI001CECDC43|nr:hypothetical protein [Streptomyces sp. TML10]
MSAPTTLQWLRTAVDRIAIGSGRLATDRAGRTVQSARRTHARARAWVTESSGLAKAIRITLLVAAAAGIRKAGGHVAHWAYDRIESGAWWQLLVASAVAWLVGAYRAGRDDWQPKQRPEPAALPPGETQPADEEQPESPIEQAPPGPPPISPVALVAAVRDIGTPHAQLKPLAEYLGTTTDVVRSVAAGMGWPVKDVRMAGRSASAGLRWDEVPSPPPTDPSPGVVGAGERADDNDDDSGGEGPGEGVRVVRTDGGLIVYDLADTHRRRGTVRR